MFHLLTKSRCTLFTLFIAATITCHAQHYPVQVNTIVTPPYSARLSDYGDVGSEKLQVIINPLDMNLVSYKIKLKLIIESLDGMIRIETDPGYLPAPLYLEGGVTEVLTGYDLQPLFDASHLLFRKGITKNAYLMSKRLPENYYRIGIVLLDYNRATYGGSGSEVPVSNFGYAQAGIFLNDPPLLNMPANNSKLTLFDPQHIVLQWTPRHRGSPNSAFTTEYVLRLYEVWNESYSAAAITQTQMPIFETTTADNRYVYGIAEPLLIPGKKYVWTIQAKDSEGRDMFRNNGLSEAYMFTWGEACRVPENITAVPVAGPGIELKWSTATGHTDYDIEYRYAGATDWYTENSLLTNSRIYKLSYNASYETRVKANCGTYFSDFSEIVKVKIPEAPRQEFSCGGASTLMPLTSSTPLTSLPPGAIFYAGGFECHVIESSFANNGLSGSCYVVVPFYGFAKVLHTFKDIRINTDLQMMSGKLTSVTDSIKGSALASRIDDALKPKGTGYTNEQLMQLLEASKIVAVDGRIESIVVNEEGNVVVTFKNGDEEIIEVEEGKSVIISDKDGQQYYVQNGKVIKADEALAAKAAEASASQQVADVNKAKELLPLVTFRAAENMEYGFDTLQYPELRSQYQENEVHGKDYVLPYKAVPTGGMDVIDAYMPTAGFNIDGLGFRINQTPTTVFPSLNENTRKVNVSSLIRGEEQVLEAFYSLTDTSGKKVEETLGQVNVVAYDEQLIKLIVVPVGKAIDYSQFQINGMINKIYSQSVIQWQIQWEDNFAWEKGEDYIFDNTDPDSRMDYTSDMKALIKAYRKENTIEKQAVYVFLYNGNYANKELKGYMPFNKQFAFVFTGGNNNPAYIAHHISHEIAHGTFNLRHTFSDENQYYQSEGNTNNLMDYASADANNLNKYQWDLIHNPESVLFSWLEEEEEGEMSLPCIGWFDDCDDVLKILETFRNARINGNHVKIKGQTKTDERTLVANSLKIGEIDYNKIRLIYKPRKADFNINPVKYDYYNQEFLLGDGSIDRQRGFVYYNNSEELFKIIVDGEAGTIGKLKDYLFGFELPIDPEDDKKVIVRINRIRNNNYRTVGTVNIDNGAITGYTLELPKGTESECQSSCTTEKKANNECTRILKGSYTFEVTSWSDKEQYINKSLRINNVPGRTGILMHRGVNARIWSSGCILAMRNDPSNDNDNASATQRTNNVDDSEAFCVEIVNYVNQRVSEIKQKYKLEAVEMKVIITEDNELIN